MNASGKTMIDFGATPSYDAGPYTISVATLTRGGLAEAWVLHESTPDHSHDEVLLAPIEVRAKVLSSEEIEIRAWSSIALTGRYRVGWVVYDDSASFQGFTYLRFPSDYLGTLTSDNGVAAGKVMDGGAMPSWTFGCWLVFGPDGETGFVGNDEGSAYVMEIRDTGGNSRVGFWFDGSDFTPDLVDNTDSQQSFTGAGFSTDGTRQEWLWVVMTYTAGGDCVGYVNGVEVQRSVAPSGSYDTADRVLVNKFRGRVYSPFVAVGAWDSAKIARLHREGPRHNLTDEGADHWWPGDGQVTSLSDLGTAGTCAVTLAGGATAQEES